jgi:hypothetical protein
MVNIANSPNAARAERSRSTEQCRVASRNSVTSRLTHDVTDAPSPQRSRASSEWPPESESGVSVRVFLEQLRHPIDEDSDSRTQVPIRRIGN